MDMISMWAVWLIIGLGLVTMEILTPGFYLASIGIAAMLTAPFSLLIHPFWGQALVFAAWIVLAMLFLRPAVNRLMNRNDVKTNTERLIGTRAKVEKCILPGEKGRVRIGGESWLATCDETLEEGEYGVVIEVGGATVKVERIHNQKEIEK